MCTIKIEMQTHSAIPQKLIYSTIFFAIHFSTIKFISETRSVHTGLDYRSYWPAVFVDGRSGAATETGRHRFPLMIAGTGEGAMWFQAPFNTLAQPRVDCCRHTQDTIPQCASASCALLHLPCQQAKKNR